MKLPFGDNSFSLIKSPLIFPFVSHSHFVLILGRLVNSKHFDLIFRFHLFSAQSDDEDQTPSAEVFRRDSSRPEIEKVSV